MKLYDENHNYVGEFITDKVEQAGEYLNDSKGSCFGFIITLLLILAFYFPWVLILVVLMLLGKFIWFLIKLIFRVLWWLIRAPFTLIFRKRFPKF